MDTNTTGKTPLMTAVIVLIAVIVLSGVGVAFRGNVHF